MDVVRQILEVMAKESSGITIRHIAHRTGLVPSTLVGVMMGMVNQGYITGVLSENGASEKRDARCTCACCTRKTDRESSSSLDRRIYQITLKGALYLQNWSDKPE